MDFRRVAAFPTGNATKINIRAASVHKHIFNYIAFDTTEVRLRRRKASA